MVYLLVRHKVKNYSQFRKAFFSNFKKVKNNGQQGGFIFRNSADKNEVFVLVKWDILKNFQNFAKSPKIPKDNLKIATVIGTPEGWIMEEYEQFFAQHKLDKKAAKKMKKMHSEVKKGEKKVIKHKDVLKKYPHLK